MVRRASSGVYHAQSVMPSSSCGTHSPRFDSNRKKWQNLWIVLPRKRKYQSMTRIGPCRTRSLSPVSSATSRRAASAGGPPGSRWPLGNPQLRYESRINRNRGPPSGPRRNTTPPAEGSRWARRCFPFTPPPHPRMRDAECGMRNEPKAECGIRNAECTGEVVMRANLHCNSAFRIPHSALSSKDAEREVLPRVRLDVGQELPQLDHREGGLAIQGRVRHQQAERPAAVRDARHHAVGRHQDADEALLVLVGGVDQVAEGLR